MRGKSANGRSTQGKAGRFKPSPDRLNAYQANSKTWVRTKNGGLNLVQAAVSKIINDGKSRQNPLYQFKVGSRFFTIVT